MIQVIKKRWPYAEQDAHLFFPVQYWVTLLWSELFIFNNKPLYYIGYIHEALAN